ncbi:MAG: hypothetical protein IH630_06225, partial [Thermoplasmata archaeon]|nr:hypothetical protein [Thermoplasmata archaeon]
LSLLAVNLALTTNQYIEWRFSNSYIGTSIVIIVLAALIWTFGYLWDRKLKLWKEQMVVSIERNPYSTMHMTPKEVVSHVTIWIPWLRERGMVAEANIWQKIVDWNLVSDTTLRTAVDMMMGKGPEKD